ncbi:MAG: ATP-binding protein [Gemmatimonadota bacterium]
MDRWWGRQSIEWKLPAAFVALLALLGGSHMIVAYRGFEQSATAAVRERLNGSASQLALLVSNSNQQRSTALGRLFESPQFAPVMEGTADPDSVLESIAQASPASSSSFVILDDGLNEIASSGAPTWPAAMDELRAVAATALELSGQLQVSRLIEEHEGAHFWSALAARRADGTRIVLAQLRRIGEGEARSSDAVESLIGATTVLVANANGSGSWVRLDGTLTPAPDAPDWTADTESYRRAGTGYLAKIVAVPGTPWLIVTETPVSAARERTVAFVRMTLPVGILVLLVGAGGAWLMARVYTRPMRAFASAAADFGRGDFGRRLDVQRRDELGLMAAAFNGMAAEVEHGYADMEERVRQRTAELEAVNHELQAFSYSVSHDLRSPLRSIDGFSQALLEDYGPSLDATARDYLKRVRGGAQRMGLLIDDLLQLARVTRQPITRNPVDLSELAAEILAELRKSEPDRAVATRIEPGLAAVGDPGLLGVALHNLLDNAWKFTSRTADPSIEFGRTEGGAFFVRDNGAGFSMEYADQLFTPFQRLHSMQEFSGTGVGLATVQRIMARHGGRVWAQAAVGIGATFFFTVHEGPHVDDTAG